jgi:glycine betaine/proline transport system ATP-binding protein
LLQVESLDKIYGPQPERAIPLLDGGMDKADVMRQTGLVVGVRRVSFSLARGEFFVIMGLSGSGKSTLLRCLNRLVTPTAGRVTIGDDDAIDVTAANDDELRRLRQERMTMVFQRFGLLPHRSVRANVAFGLEVRGRKRAERDARADEILAMVGLEGWGDTLPHALSGGMQQRVGLARAIATGAEILLMDEPFSALDPLIKVQMQNEMIRLQRQLGRTIVFITHDLDEALRLGDRIAIMDDGAFVQVGTPERIVTEPKTPYVADFVAHADPTGVISAGTVAVPPRHERIDVERDGDLTRLTHRTQSDVTIVIDDAGSVHGVHADGAVARCVAIDELLNEPTPASRARDRVAVVPAHYPLKALLEARSRCNLPVLVTDDRQRLVGLVTEREIIHAILAKRGPTEAGTA